MMVLMMIIIDGTIDIQDLFAVFVFDLNFSRLLSLLKRRFGMPTSKFFLFSSSLSSHLVLESQHLLHHNNITDPWDSTHCSHDLLT